MTPQNNNPSLPANPMNHKSFYGFYPSEVFDFGEAKTRIQELEESNRELSNLMELKELYKLHMPPSLSDEEIIRKCEYSKKLLGHSTDDITVFSENSQRTAGELVPLMSLFISVMALCSSAFGGTAYSIFFLIFGVFATVGTCFTYVKSTDMRTANSKLMESYRQMLMCFETVEEMVEEKKH